MPRIGFLTPSALIAAFLVIVFAVGVTLVSGGGLFSPGPLNTQPGPAPLGGAAAHAGLRDCAVCHPAPWSGQSMSGLCLNCHTDLKSDPKNFHTVMVAQGQQSTCTACHTEHHGANASLTHMDLQDFPHASLGFSLQGHPKMADGSPFLCTGCHTGGYKRFDALVCSTCHTLLKADFMKGHVAAFGPDCLACHDGLDTYGPDFDHQKAVFPLVGKHTPLDCAKCHTQVHSIADLKAAPQTCGACHAKDDAHQGGLGSDCAQCHTPEGWEQAKIDHALTRFALAGKHQAVECAACHVNSVFKGTAATCFACHSKVDTHQSALGQDCAKCHTPLDWKQATIDHAVTRFALTGKHLTLNCAACHVNNQWKGISTTCYACHAKNDTHKGQYGQDCAACHTTSGWLPATFNHAKSSFPLTGAHLKVACLKCHLSGPNGVVFKGTSSACSACHADPAYHKGLLGLNCVACHTTTAWTPAKFSQPHTFPINHEGAGGNCRRCHPSTLAQYTCYTCHNQSEMANEHRGRGNITNCVACHPTGREGGGGD